MVYEIPINPKTLQDVPLIFAFASGRELAPAMCGRGRGRTVDPKNGRSLVEVDQKEVVWVMVQEVVRQKLRLLAAFKPYKFIVLCV